MGGIVNTIKRVFIQLVIIVAVVLIAAAIVAVIAPTLLSVVLPATGEAIAAMSWSQVMGAVISAGVEYLTSAQFILGAVVMVGISYMSDQHNLEQARKLEAEKAAAEGQVLDHFSQMEADRLKTYDAPALGMVHTRDQMTEYEKEQLGVSSGRSNFAVAAAVLGTLAFVTLSGGDDHVRA